MINIILKLKFMLELFKIQQFPKNPSQTHLGSTFF